MPIFHRIAESLRDQRQSLMDWLRFTPEPKKALRMGSLPPEAVQSHVHLLDTAIASADRGELGRCTVCQEFVETHWLETNYTTSVCLEHLSGAERSSLEAELELAQKVQKALLPQEAPQVPGWELAAFSQPASIVGGDYFDFLRFRDGATALIIADVMGKGMPASMLMASLQAYLRVILPESTGPDEVLHRLNHLFCHNIRLTKFVSVAIIRLDLETGALSYANAGHHPPFILRQGRDGDFVTCPLPPTGAAIGLVEGAVFAVRSDVLQKNDQLVLYTDGVVEASNESKEEFGEERLLRQLSATAGCNSGVVIRELRSAVRGFTGAVPLADDTTILVAHRLETSI